MQIKKYVQMELDYKYNDLADPNHFYERSDHYNFAKHGVPSVLYLTVSCRLP
jgi:Zn-dependent M28 family amino/carboxypeptidase